MSKSKSGKMKGEAKRELKPKLRFPEFVEQEIQAVRLEDVTAESRIRNEQELPSTAVMGVSKVEGIVPMEERIIAKDISRYKLLQTDWFAYNPMRLNIGSIARWQGESDVLVSPDYVVFNCTNEDGLGIDPAYLDHFRHSYPWEQFVDEAGDGGVRVRIYYKDIARLQLALPSILEQQKIADCLSSLDELIAAHSRKLDALKAHKKGLMQQLFPREGKTLPRLRFPEFKDAPVWEEDSLINLAQFRRGSFPQPYGLPKWYDQNNGMPFVQVYDVDDNFRLKPVTKNRITPAAAEQSVFIPKGTIVVTLQGSIGRVAITQYDAYVDRTLLLFESFRRPIETVFFAYVIYNLFEIEKQKAPGGIIKTITKEVLSGFVVKLPSPEEQKRVADTLSTLDDLIAAQTQKMKSLNDHKTGLMQQLFPSLEEN